MSNHEFIEYGAYCVQGFTSVSITIKISSKQLKFIELGSISQHIYYHTFRSTRIVGQNVSVHQQDKVLAFSQTRGNGTVTCSKRIMGVGMARTRISCCFLLLFQQSYTMFIYNFIRITLTSSGQQDQCWVVISHNQCKQS